MAAAVVLPFFAAPAGAQVRIDELGAWGGRINDMAVKDNILYFHSGGRIVIADVSNPADPVELSAIDMRNMAGTVKVRGNILYVGGDRVNVCFRAYDVSDPAHPALLYHQCGFFGGSPRDIVFWNDIAYTLHGTDVHSFDLSDPTRPVYHDGVYFSLGGPMAVSGDYLYMSNDRAKLLIFDLAGATDPYRPPLITQFQLPSGDESGSIVISGTRAYVQPYSGNLTVVDISDPAAPSVVGTVPNTTPPNEDANNLAISNGVLYACVRVGIAGQLMLFDVGTDPDHPALIATYATDAAVNGVRVSGTTAYLTDEGEGVIMLDCSNPASPVRVGDIPGPEWMRKEALDGDLLYVTDKWHGLSILDVSDPNHIPMNPVASYDSGGDENWGIVVQDGLAYLSAGTAGLEILDVSNPASPALVGEFPIPSFVTHFDDVAVSNGVAYVGASWGSGVCASFLLSLDVEDPANVQLLDSVQIGPTCRVPNVELIDDGTSRVIYAVNDWDDVAVIDATDPSALAVAPPSGPDAVTGIAVDRSHALRYTVTRYDESQRGLYIHDIANEASPALLSFTPLIPGSQSSSCEATSVGARGGLACAVACTMHVLDVSDPANPLKVGETPESHTTPDLDVTLDGPLMYGVSGINPAGVIIDLVALPGDFDGDLAHSLADVDGFVDCLLDSSPAACRIGDMNDDGATDGRDVASFVQAILN